MLLFTLKTAIRNLLRAKQNAFIIMLSLTISFAFTNILITFISHEMNTDAFHGKKDKIYRLFSDDPFEQGRKLRYIQGDVSRYLMDHFPEVDKVCKVTAFNQKGNTLSIDDNVFSDQLLLAVDSTFFEFFDFQLLEGNRNEAIVRDGIVLKETLAAKLLGKAPFTGRTISITNGKDIKSVKVTAVLKNFHENTQFKFDAIVSGHEMFGGSVFLMLDEKADPGILAQKISVSEATPSLIAPGKSNYELESFTDTYFNPANVQPYDMTRNKQLIVICWVVVLLLSFTASFNFINLYVVGLLTRRKEIGVKRVFGISKGNMILSIGMEVGIYVVISILCSLVLTYYLMPFFNASLGAKLSFSYFTYLKVLSIVIGSMLILALLITLYLVVFTWKLNPIGLINDRLADKVKANQFMFIVQFFISVGLVICSFVVISQIQYIKNKPLGFNKHLLQLQVTEKDQRPRLHVLKEKLLTYPQVSKVALSSGNPISGNAIVRLELEDKTVFSPFLISGDEDLATTMGLTIIEGESFKSNNKLGKLVNETFIKHFDMDDPIGQDIPGTEGFIAGVVKDFNSRSLKQEIPPYILSYDDNCNFLLIDISTSGLQQVMPLVTKEWKQVFPNESMNYKLIEDELMERHKEDALFFQMIISFTLASLIISCFGLYGIASFTCSRRTKEIGIRKVLGASFANIILLVWKDYLKLIFISYILAVPVANYFLTEWLQEFAYKIELSWWLYAIPEIAIVAIAFFTISGQLIKAAHSNPLESIKNE